MRYFALILIFVCQTAYGQVRNRFAVDPYGHSINAARLPGEVEKRTVRLGEMDVGERVQVYANAMIVDDAGRCWLNPNHVAFPLKTKGELEVINNKLGYIVRVNYHYAKLDGGYSVPRWPSWTRGYVPSYYIPVKTVMVDKPHYDEPSPSLSLSLKMQRPYNPRFEAPVLPPNPYSWESQNVRSPSSRRPDNRANRRPGNSTGPRNDRGILPELTDGIE